MCSTLYDQCNNTLFECEVVVLWQFTCENCNKISMESYNHPDDSGSSIQKMTISKIIKKDNVNISYLTRYCTFLFKKMDMKYRTRNEYSFVIYNCPSDIF